jgi:hypothetical protein
MRDAHGDRHQEHGPDWTPVEEKKANPLGISIPGGWKRKGGLKGAAEVRDKEEEEDEKDVQGRGRKRSVTWEKE